MFQKVFMVLLPLKYASENRVVPEGKYNCVVEGFGLIGQLQCITVSNTVVGSLNAQTGLIAESNSNYKQTLLKSGYNLMTEVQCCTFLFLRRNNKAFNDLWKKVATDLKIELAPEQATLAL